MTDTYSPFIIWLIFSSVPWSVKALILVFDFPVTVIVSEQKNRKINIFLFILRILFLQRILLWLTPSKNCGSLYLSSILTWYNYLYQLSIPDNLPLPDILVTGDGSLWHFLPIINWGRYREENGKLMMRCYEICWNKKSRERWTDIEMKIHKKWIWICRTVYYGWLLIRLRM